MAENNHENEALGHLKDQILEALETVIDPELGIDIINLGLVYSIGIDDSRNVLVNMTLTFMGCPLSESLSHQIEDTLLKIKIINKVNVNFVWDPPWTKDRMSRYARIALGLPDK